MMVLLVIWCIALHHSNCVFPTLSILRQTSSKSGQHLNMVDEISLCSSAFCQVGALECHLFLLYRLLGKFVHFWTQMAV